MFGFLLFVTGLFIGSFLGVLADRLPRRESVVQGRSHCGSCQHTLAPHDLIPVISYFYLRGKCRYCRASIGWEYPAVECMTGILFLITYLYHGELLFTNRIADVLTFLYYLTIISVSVVVFVTDLKYGVILNKVTAFGVVVTAFYLTIFLSGVYWEHLLAGVGASLFFFFLFAITKGRGMGFGDVKFVFLMGFFLGFPGIVVGLYIAFLTGALIASILILWHKKKLQGGVIPFGPFLITGTIATFFLRDVILQWVKLLQ